MSTPSLTPPQLWNRSSSLCSKQLSMSTSTDMNSVEPILLNGPSDWRKWIAQIQRLALEDGIWHLVDPSVADKSVLAKPCEPRASQVKPEAEGLEDLQGYETHKLEFLYSAYRVQKMDFDKKERALSALNNVVIGTSGRYSHLVSDQHDVVVNLAVLKARVPPSDWAIKMQARNRYRALLRTPDVSKMEDWIDAWQLALDEATSLDLPDIHGLLPTQDFLQAVSVIDPSFAAFWTQTIEFRAFENAEGWERSIPDGIRISEIFSRTAKFEALTPPALAADSGGHRM
ncbi:integrase, catalytic core [Ophiocordyceps camponoti-floridani]|uniref:Integrase, catalytic core n=1 Tax=Ophiocordyceps camponoti-floridani TaxID=2030778 RepID=A0A8H4VE48_9HYPO|nr:integrase, catalytic core [Ophiocordyceps camponoti-floridani]